MAHSTCSGAPGYHCGALCKVPMQIKIFLIEVPLYQWKKIAVRPLHEQSSRPLCAHSYEGPLQ